MASTNTPGGSDAFKLVPAAMLDLIKSSDFTPEVIEKIFKDIGASPEKLRAIMNIWFGPNGGFRPNFVPDANHAVSGLQDVEFLSTINPLPAQLPYRMFDIETGNLVEFPAIGARGQYCMLSHRWKGLELLLGDIKRARAQDLERAKDEIRAARAANPGARLLAGRSARKDDVQLVLEQCQLEIAEQEEVIQELYLASESSATTESFSLANLLNRRLKAKGVENRLEWAKNGEDSARTKLKFAEMESEIFSDLISNARKGMEGADASDASSELSVVNDMRNNLTEAEKELLSATAEYKATLDDINFFKNHNRIRDAVDELVLRLQRWKSAIKLDRVIKEADRIFKTKLFQRREKCYLWTDTCCIDKTNAGELSESLSLMGDWYNNAEFCLVQLDTNSSDADAALDWRLFQEGRGKKAEPLLPGLSHGPKKVIRAFEEIAASKPEWSTRAWTLQELVMSKTTFYLNANWDNLSRPVESLGYFYHLMPFIALYTQRDTQNIFAHEDNNLTKEMLLEILGDHDVADELKYVRVSTERAHTSPPPGLKGVCDPNEIAAKAEKEASHIERAQLLVILLDGLGVRFPKVDLALETATSELARVVYLAAADLAGNTGDSPKTAIFSRLRGCLKRYKTSSELEAAPSTKKAREADALNVVNFLLRSLVQETLELVLEDRKYVAKFGLVEKLGAWQEGKRRSGFAAQNVFAASGNRVATVATDRAYALMGILGVRFPTFPAEGYAMALARLLDQVIVTHNDVSVFNWSGMEMGSPIRGRSLYPSSHVAFGNQEDRGRHYNLLLSSQVQGKMDDVMQTYHQTISVLRRAIDTVKDKNQKDLPFDWIFGVIDVVERSGFYQLKADFKSVGKIIGFILMHCVRKVVPAEPSNAGTGDKVVEEKETPSGSGISLGLTKGFSLPSLPSPTISLPSPSLSFPSPSLSVAGFKMGIGGSKKEDAAADTQKKGSKFSAFGKKSSFGLGKQTQEPAPEPTASPVPAPAPPAPQSPPITAPDPAPEALPKSNWEDLDEDVKKHLNFISNRQWMEPKHLPTEVLEVDHDFILSQPDPRSKKDGINTRLGFGPDFDHDSTICPNPIIVNNSGIEGLFDIQRCIVTMIDHDRLRSRIAKAVTPKDKISGWCSISTGFARVIAGFSCEKRLLEQELNAVEGIESKVLREQYKSKDEKRGAQLLSDMVVSPVKSVAGNNSPDGAGQGVGEGRGDKNAPDIDKETDEERLVSRMIEFIQEPQLQLVAGEWVLARFSGTPGAKWFLCHLELGSSPGQYYGHRIATGEIDFSNSTPEPGLVKAWQVYMERKKKKMCHILERYLRSRVSGKKGEARFEDGVKTLSGTTTLSPISGGKNQADDDVTLVDKEHDSDGEYEGEDSAWLALDGKAPEGMESEDTSWRKFRDQGKAAAKAFGEFTVYAAAEKFFQMRAEHLERTLSTAVLKKTPTRLRTAVENMNDNKSFLPAMFHSATRVHMF